MSQLENSTTTRITEKLHPGGSVEAAGMSLESDYNSNQLSNEAGGLHTNGRTGRGGNLASSSYTYTSPSYSASSPLSTQDHLAASEGDTHGSEELDQELGRMVEGWGVNIGDGDGDGDHSSAMKSLGFKPTTLQDYYIGKQATFALD